MGRVSVLRSFNRAMRGLVAFTAVVVDRGGGDNRTLEHFSPPGDDSHPLPDDYVTAVEQIGTGRDSAVGYLDPSNAQKAAPGDKRIYSRTPEGELAAEVWLKNDGTIAATNGAGHFTLQPDGVVNINGVTIDPAGLITTPAGLVSPSALVNSKELAEHDHPAGSPPGDTGVNNP